MVSGKFPTCRAERLFACSSHTLHPHPSHPLAVPHAEELPQPRVSGPPRWRQAHLLVSGFGFEADGCARARPVRPHPLLALHAPPPMRAASSSSPSIGAWATTSPPTTSPTLLRCCSCGAPSPPLAQPPVSGGGGSRGLRGRGAACWQPRRRARATPTHPPAPPHPPNPRHATDVPAIVLERPLYVR